MSARPRKNTHAGLTDVGRIRSHNEDAILLEPPLYAVADGLGGHEAGEVASNTAIDALAGAAPRRPDAKALGRAVRAANRAVIQAAHDGLGREGMGTTLTAAVVEGGRIAVAHVADSRAYLLHDGALERITDDHSVVADMIRQGTLTEEQSRTHPNRSVITRALGTDSNMYPDTFEVDAEPGDRLLLCSDGLTGMLPDDEIAEILDTYRDPDVAVRMLVDRANEAGGHDNVSVVVVDIEGGRGTLPTPHVPRGWVSVLVWTFAFLAVLGVAGWGTYRYAHERAYLVDEEGVVVLYRGVPGEFAGYSLRWIEAETTIPVSALDIITAQRLEAGVPVENVDAAYDLIEQYRARIEPPAEEPSPEPEPGAETDDAGAP